MLLFLEPHLLSVSMELAEERCTITVTTLLMDKLTGENHGHKVSIMLMEMPRFLTCSISQKPNQNQELKLSPILGNMITMSLPLVRVSILLKRALRKTFPSIPSPFTEARTGFSKTTLCTKKISPAEPSIHQRKDLMLELDLKVKTSGD